MKKIIIDATNLIVGRFATFAAKQALLGSEIIIINSEKAVIAGKKDKIFEDYLNRRSRGTPLKGPYISRSPERLLKRIIRGMLPYKKPRGREALKRVLCYCGIPKEYEGQASITISGANLSKLPTLDYVNLKTLSKRLGAKIE